MFSTTSFLSPAERVSSLIVAFAVPALLLTLSLLAFRTVAGDSGTSREVLVSFRVAPTTQAEPAKPAEEAEPEEQEKEVVRQPAPPQPNAQQTNARQNSRTPDVEIAIPVAQLVQAVPAGVVTPVAVASQEGQRVPQDASAQPAARSASIPAQERVKRARDSAYAQDVYRRIEAHQRYEQVLQRQNIEGSVTVAFTIDARGRIKNAQITNSSGNKVLDRVALRHLKDASPFARPPAGAPHSFEIPLTYRQRD